MNLILFANHELNHSHHLTLTDHRFTHIRDIHRARVGEYLRVGEINGLMGSGQIIRIDDKSVEMEVTLSEPPPAKIPLTLILALPRPKMTRRLFRTVAELGISKLHIINSYKVEKSYWQSPSIRPENVERYLLDGLQQAKDTVPPMVRFHPLFKPFVEDQLPGLAADTLKLLAHPETGTACPDSLDRAITLAIGPEGGFTRYEVEKFMAAEFAAIHLGPRILRVENAVTALASRLFSC